MSKIHYVTAKGLEDLKAKLHYKVTVERPDVVRAIAEARDKGDLSENSEYDAARERQGLLELEIAKLEETIATARIIDESKLNTDFVQMLNTVKVKNLKTNKEFVYTLVGETEANLKEGKISVKTPIGAALLGKKRGDVVSVQVPAGINQFEILDITI